MRIHARRCTPRWPNPAWETCVRNTTLGLTRSDCKLYPCVDSVFESVSDIVVDTVFAVCEYRMGWQGFGF